MGKKTIFLILDKPDPDEFYNIGVYNKNLDKIDAELERQNTYIKELERKLTGNIVYGFHINGEESDPDKMVSYIADAVGMTPAYMDFDKDTFNYGSWKDAFFMPRPCMLKYDGTVDYYLDENDYTKRADGGGDSDVKNVSYEGNAMMEWGKDGRLIWVKVVPDQNPISGSVYIANYQADADFHAWSFENASGTLSEHFYTAIYKTYDEFKNNRSRSLSLDYAMQESAENCIAYAKNNNVNDKEMWYIEVLSDVMIEEFLLILIAKTTNLRSTFGNGTGNSLGNGKHDSKGLFYGTLYGKNDDGGGIKVFGMSNFWNDRRYSGYILDHGIQKIKMTYSDADGQSGGYSKNGENYIDIGLPLEQCGSATYIKEMQFNKYGMFPKTPSKDIGEKEYYCSDIHTNISIVAVAHRGANRANSVNFIDETDSTAALPRLSCKPY